jgi:Mn2+/Fe2+ NRAMP family transporter
VIAVTLLPAALVFLILLLNQEELMGKYKNTFVQNVIGLSIVTMIVVLSTLYAISVLFPEMFHQ